MVNEGDKGAVIMYRGDLGMKFRNANAEGHETSYDYSPSLECERGQGRREGHTSLGLYGRNDHAIPHRLVVPCTNSPKA